MEYRRLAGLCVKEFDMLVLQLQLQLTRLSLRCLDAEHPVQCSFFYIVDLSRVYVE